MDFMLLILMTLLFNCQALFCRLYSPAYKGRNSSAASSVYSIIFGLTIGLVTLAMGGFTFKPSLTTVICGALNAVMLYIYNTSLVKGSVLGSYGLLMVCSLSGNMLLPVFWDAIYNGTPITVLQIAALVLLIASFVLMNSGDINKERKKGYYLFCASLFLTNGFFGSILNTQQQLSAGGQRTEMVVTTYLGMSLFLLILSLIKNRSGFIGNFRMGKKALLFAAASCIAATVSHNLKIFLITRTDLTLLYAFSNGGMVVTSTILAAILFKEKLTLPRIIGIVLSCAGIMMLCP